MRARQEKGWALKNWCLWTVVLEETFESPLDSKETKPVNPKGNQPWIFIGRTVAEADAPIFWPSDLKSQLIGKDPNDGKDWRQAEKGTTEDEMIDWHHQLNGLEFEQTLGDSDGQGSLAGCSPLGRSVRYDWSDLAHMHGSNTLLTLQVLSYLIFITMLWAGITTTPIWQMGN